MRSADGGFASCELLGRCGAAPLGAHGDTAELRSRGCFHYDPPLTAPPPPPLSVAALTVSFAGGLLVFGLPLLCWALRRRAARKAAVRVAEEAAPAPPPSQLAQDLEADAHRLHSQVTVAHAASDLRYAAKVAERRRERGLTQGDWSRRALVEAQHAHEEASEAGRSKEGLGVVEELRAEEKAVHETVDTQHAESDSRYSKKVAEKRRARNMTAGVFARSAATKLAHAEERRREKQQAAAAKEKQEELARQAAQLCAPAFSLCYSFRAKWPIRELMNAVQASGSTSGGGSQAPGRGDSPASGGSTGASLEARRGESS